MSVSNSVDCNRYPDPDDEDERPEPERQEPVKPKPNFHGPSTPTGYFEMAGIRSPNDT